MQASPKNIALAILTIPIILMWLVGVGYLLSGFILGSLVVGGLMITIEQILGQWFWRFATTTIGLPVVAILTSLLTHYVVPGGTAIALIAAAWALFAKAFILHTAKSMKQREQMGVQYTQMYHAS